MVFDVEGLVVGSEAKKLQQRRPVEAWSEDPDIHDRGYTTLADSPDPRPYSEPQTAGTWIRIQDD